MTDKPLFITETAMRNSAVFMRQHHNRPGRLLHGLLWLIAIAACLTLTACDSGRSSEGSSLNKDGKPVVVTSIPPLASLVQTLMGDWGHAESLLPAGSSVHGYEPSASQMHTASQAQLLVVVGRNLDGWAQTLTQRAAGKREVPVFTFAQAIDGTKGLNQNVHVPHESHGEHEGHDDHADHHDHGHDHAGLNPHLWLDPTLTRQFVKAIATRIEALAPNDDAKAATREAAMTLDAQLAALDDLYKSELASLVRKDMVTFHNAFDLMADRYGLNVAAHLTDVELAPGGEVTASQLIDAIKTIRQLKLKVLYAEPQFPERATHVITQETGATILRLDPLGGKGLPGYDSYFDMMNSNLTIIIKGQSIP